VSQGDQTTLDPEFDQCLIVEPRPWFLELPLFGEKLRGERGSEAAASTFADPARQIEGVFVARWRECLAMECVAAVTIKVGELRTGNEERVQAVVESCVANDAVRKRHVLQRQDRRRRRVRVTEKSVAEPEEAQK
jgi:hypothetical protein